MKNAVGRPYFAAALSLVLHSHSPMVKKEIKIHNFWYYVRAFRTITIFVAIILIIIIKIINWIIIILFSFFRSPHSDQTYGILKVKK